MDLTKHQSMYLLLEIPHVDKLVQCSSLDSCQVDILSLFCFLYLLFCGIPNILISLRVKKNFLSVLCVCPVDEVVHFSF